MDRLQLLESKHCMPEQNTMSLCTTGTHYTQACTDTIITALLACETHSRFLLKVETQHHRQKNPADATSQYSSHVYPALAQGLLHTGSTDCSPAADLSITQDHQLFQPLQMTSYSFLHSLFPHKLQLIAHWERCCYWRVPFMHLLLLMRPPLLLLLSAAVADLL